MKGYELRNMPTIIEDANMFDLKRPRRRTFEQWIADMQALSGARDASQDDLTDEQIQAAFAESYALAECADGRARERNPDEIRE